MATTRVSLVRHGATVLSAEDGFANDVSHYAGHPIEPKTGSLSKWWDKEGANR